MLHLALNRAFNALQISEVVGKVAECHSQKHVSDLLLLSNQPYFFIFILQYDDEWKRQNDLIEE